MTKNALLIISPNYKPRLGGSAELTHKLARSLCAKGWRVVILAPEQVGDKEFDKVQPFSTVRISFNTSGILRYLDFWRVLRRLLREHEIRYVLASTTIPIGWFQLLGLQRIPRGIIFHGNDLYKIQNRSLLRRFWYRFFIREKTRVFSNSRFTAELARDVLNLREDPVVIGCGISPELLPPPVSRDKARRRLEIGARHPVLLTVGRLVAYKGVDMVIRSLPRIVEKYPDLVYLIAGEGKYRPNLEHLAEATGVARHTRFLGAFADEDLACLYGAADIFVMPSRVIPQERSVEGFGIVFAEAGYYGLPVIGGNAGGTPDAIDEKKTGFLVNPESVSEIGDAIAELLADPELRRRMGQAGRRRVEARMLWDHVAQRVQREILSHIQ